MNIPQADRWLPTSALRWIGGLRTYGARLTFYLGIMNTGTLMFVLYNQSGFIQSVFPSALHWLAFLAIVVVPAIIVVDYALFHVAEITYNAHQNSQANRNPGYRLTEQNNEMLRRMMHATDGGEEDDER